MKQRKKAGMLSPAFPPAILLSLLVSFASIQAAGRIPPSEASGQTEPDVQTEAAAPSSEAAGQAGAAVRLEAQAPSSEAAGRAESVVRLEAEAPFSEAAGQAGSVVRLEASTASSGTSVFAGKTDAAAETGSAPSSGKNIDASSPESIEGLVADIDQKYGIRILYGEDAPRIYTDYTAAPVKDRKKIRSILSIIGDVLSVYPPGFFLSVKEGFCDSICICLASDLRAIDGDCYMDDTEAFTTVKDGSIWLVLNAETEIRKTTLFHELTHVADYRLLGMGELSEEEWARLNPPSFRYYNDYLDENGESYRFSGSREYTSLKEKDPDRIYFYDSYSKTFAMEDRARLMEKLLEEPGDRCFSSPHVRTKLRFYFYTLRTAFENGDWPEKTTWEEALESGSFPDGR